MITYYKNTENGLAVLTEPVDNCWINVIDPGPEEQARLVAMGIPHDYIIYPLDVDERARTERENGELLIILRIPHFMGKEADIPYITVPMGIILTPKYIVTVCRQDNQIYQDLITGRVRNLSTAKRYRFVLRLLLATATMYLNNLREITKSVDALEDQLQLSTRNKEVLRFAEIPEEPDLLHHRPQIERVDGRSACSAPVCSTNTPRTTTCWTMSSPRTSRRSK